MHWNGSIDMNTSGLREGGMFTDRRQPAHGPILEEGGGTGGDQTHLSQSGHVFASASASHTNGTQGQH